MTAARPSIRPLLLAATVAAAFAACGGKTAATVAVPDAPKPTAAPVVRLAPATMQRHGLATAAAAPRALRRSFVAPGTVAFDADATANVTTLAAGRVVELRAGVGARVQAGDVLVVLESRELGEAQSAWRTQRAAAAALAPGVALAEEAWRRAKALHDESQGIALAEVRRREIDHQQALAPLRAAENGARAAADALRLLGMDEAAIDALAADGAVRPRIELRAPIAGEVVRRDVALGDMVDADTGALVALVDPSRRHVRAHVPEAFAAEVAVGAEAIVRAPHAPGRAVATAVAYAAPRLDEATRSRAVRLPLPADAPGLHAGMSVDAQVFVAAAGEPALAIPAAAVQLLERRHVVFVPVAGDEGAFTERPVEVGAAVDGFVPVRAGLRAGELVVADGSFVVKAQATLGAPGEEK